jgi:Ser/Thr protein kinase RdoA (MazF antagonist)
LEWIEGRMWSSVNPQLDELRYSLGEACGEITNLLQDFLHPKALRVFDWDIAQAGWTYPYQHLFRKEEKECIVYFTDAFEKIQSQFQSFRKSVIHNDANDNNIIVSNDLVNPRVETIIDFGDSAYTQTINDLVVAIAYGLMDQPDPLSAALPGVAGYHKKFPLFVEELKALYVLTAMRLVLSVTKSAINIKKEPGNVYLQISDKQAWAL